MKKGKVKFFNKAKGFGFIQQEYAEEDIFVHVSGLVHEISEDDRVQFDIVQGRKGLSAVNVKVIN